MTYQAATTSRPASDNAQLSVPKRDRIPALEELKRRNQWLVWRYEKRGQEPTKVPYQSLRPAKGASSTEPRTWSTFDDAARALRNVDERIDGVGFVFKPGGGLAGLDIDDSLDERGALLDWARPIAEPFLARGAYAEVSPSGRGLKFFMRGAVPHEAGEGLAHAVRDEAGRQIGKIEIYSQARFFTVTGRRWPGAGDSLVDCQEPLSALYLAHKGQTARAEVEALELREIAKLDARSLLGGDGIPFRLSDQSQTRKLLSNALARSAFKKAGSSDTDWSVLRWIVCKGLVLARYPDDEIAALMWHYEGLLNGTKRTADFLQDVARSTAKWRAQYPHIKPEQTRFRRNVDEATAAERLQHIADEPRKSRARADRPQKVAGAAGYLQWLRSRADAHTGAVMLSLSQAAEALQISRRSVLRYEHALKEAGLVERRVFAGRQAGCIFLLEASRRGDNIPEKAPRAPLDTVVTGQELSRVLTPQNDNAAAQKEHAAVFATPPADEPPASGQVEPPRRVPSPDAPAGAAPNLRQLVALALDDDSRASLAKVRAYLADNGLADRWPAAAVTEIYEQERDERARARELARVEGLEIKALVRERDIAQRHIKNGLALRPERDARDSRDDAEERYLERLRRWRADRKALRVWQSKHAHLCDVLALKREAARSAKPAPPMLEALALVDEPPVEMPTTPLVELEEPPGAPEPGSDGYSVDCAEYAGGRIIWRLWDDALDRVIAEFGTREAAEGYVINGFVELHRAARAERQAAENIRIVQPWRAPKTILAA